MLHVHTMTLPGASSTPPRAKTARNTWPRTVKVPRAPRPFRWLRSSKRPSSCRTVHLPYSFAASAGDAPARRNCARVIVAVQSPSTGLVRNAPEGPTLDAVAVATGRVVPSRSTVANCLRLMGRGSFLTSRASHALRGRRRLRAHPGDLPDPGPGERVALESPVDGRDAGAQPCPVERRRRDDGKRSAVAEQRLEVALVARVSLDLGRECRVRGAAQSLPLLRREPGERGPIHDDGLGLGPQDDVSGEST